MGRSKASNQRSGSDSGSATARPQMFDMSHRNQQDVQNAISHHWSNLPDGAQALLADSNHDVTLHKLIDFWRAQQPLTLHNGSITTNMCGSSWYLALNYSSLGNYRAARNLLLNGGFLQEAYFLPMSDIIQAANTLSSQHPDQQRLLPRFRSASFSASSPGTMKAFLTKAIPSEYQRMMNFASRTTNGPVSEYVDLISCDWNTTTKDGKGRSSKEATKDLGEICIVVIDELTREKCKVSIERSKTLKTLFNHYAEVRNTSLRSLRFSFEGRTLFLSSAKNKTPEDLCLKDNDIIFVNDLNQKQAEGAAKEGGPSQGSHCEDSSSKSKKVKKIKKKKKQKQKAQNILIEKTQEELKIEHSKKLTKIHEEVQPRFKQLRQRLNNLVIERSRPKVKSHHPKFVPPLPQTINPPTSGLAGKAGKSQYIVQVGEIHNLYKTRKPLRSSANNSQLFSIDLHGCTKVEAIQQLDERLSQWNDAAMSGCYPFVVPVQIICGCGHQVLSEAVEQWIKQNEKVSNAPKNLWVPQRNCPYPYAA